MTNGCDLVAVVGVFATVNARTSCDVGQNDTFGILRGVARYYSMLLHATRYHAMRYQAMTSDL